VVPLISISGWKTDSSSLGGHRAIPRTCDGMGPGLLFVTPNLNISGRRPFELLKEDPARVASLAQAFVHPADVF
jgi:hypothetical protein